MTGRVSSLGPEILDRFVPEAVPGIRVLPVVHARIEVAVWVRAALDALDPAGVAVELPTTLDEAARRAVARLPRITLVIAQDRERRPDEQAVVWTVAPGDPFAEALRWAAERDRERFLVDPDIPYAERTEDPVPDPLALLELGPAGYFGPLLEALRHAPASEGDRRREAGMAYHLLRARQQLDALGHGGALVAAVGAAHAERLAAALRGPTATPFARVHRGPVGGGTGAEGSVDLRHLDPEALTALLPDPPLAHAVWERLRSGWSPGEDRPEAAPATGAEQQADLDAAAAAPLSITRAGLTLIHRARTGAAGDEDERERLDRLIALAARRGARALPWSTRLPVPDRAPDRRALATVAWEVGARSYERQTRETVAPWQRRTFFDYLRRLARVGGTLAGGLYEWVVAARGVGDDNLAWEVFDTARAFPWQGDADDLPVAHVDGSDLLLPEEWGTRTVRFRRRFFRVKQRPVAVPVRQRPRPTDPAEWLAGFAGGGSLCSYPPEDLVIEDYGRFLRQRASGILSAERTRTEPFATSMLDGIDLRETLHHPEDPRIWVREQGRAPGKAGSVVVIFDRDRPPAGGAAGWTPRYPYLMTWLGEHHDESDMAFYSTHPAEQVVGPGILRATYGGFLMTIPPGRLFDVWRDPDYRGLVEKAEILLAAAVDYSEERFVVHVAARAPRDALRHYAATRDKRIVHIPLGSLSPRTLAKIRVLHILVGHDKRAIAKDYVW